MRYFSIRTIISLSDKITNSELNNLIEKKTERRGGTSNIYFLEVFVE